MNKPNAFQNAGFSILLFAGITLPIYMVDSDTRFAISAVATCVALLLIGSAIMPTSKIMRLFFLFFGVVTGIASHYFFEEAMRLGADSLF